MSTPLARICVGNEWKTHGLHYRVVNRAVGVLLALALHRPHDLLATVRVTLPLTHISHRYLNELRRIRVQRGVQTVELVETATDDAVRAQQLVQVEDDRVHRRQTRVRIVVRDTLRGEEEHRGCALHVQTVAEVVH